jgi:hypothetical protein
MSYKIVKLHGCSGAGKTTVARALMLSALEVHAMIPDNMPDGKPNKSGKPEAYVCEFAEDEIPICVLGSYQNNCGGMDSYASDAASIIKLIEYFHTIGHVLFEGLLLSTYYGGVGKHLEQYGDDFICAFMDTPILTCLERVTHRRDVQGSKNKFNPQLTIDKYNTIERLKIKCKQNGRRVIDIKHDQDPLPQLKTLFMDAS